MTSDNTMVLPEECLIVIYDLREAGTLKELLEQQAAWGNHTCIENLPEGRVALIILPGGSREVRR